MANTITHNRLQERAFLNRFSHLVVELKQRPNSDKGSIARKYIMELAQYQQRHDIITGLVFKSPASLAEEEKVLVEGACGSGGVVGVEMSTSC